MKLNILLVLMLFGVLCSVKCGRILGIFPFSSRSHYILGNSLMKGLAEAGHNVTLISPFEDIIPPKRGSYNNVVLTGFYEEYLEMVDKMNLFEMDHQSPIARIFMQSFTLPINTKTLEHPNVQNLINSGTEFDVIVLEQFMTDVLKIFGYIFKAPLIILSPMISYLYSFPKSESALKNAVSDSPNFYELYHNVSLVLLNSHVSFNQPVPLVPNMIEIGGYHVKPPKKLPKDLQEYLDSAKEGVVYFSMGSNLKSKDMLPERKEMFLRIFKKLKQKVLWKFEDENLPGQPTNVKIEKWLPQQDILAHPNVKVFITHGGLLSTTETVYHGVPILAIPVFGDQPQNARTATSNGYALNLPYHDPDFSEEKLSNLLNELLNNSQYRDNVKKRSKIFHDRPLKPMENAVYWVEYVIRNGGAPHLKVAGVDLPWYKYHLLDVIAFLLGVTVIMLGF
ncbi:hypothetical protein NQ317_005131, partial [Molorchus minor]